MVKNKSIGWRDFAGLAASLSLLASAAIYGAAAGNAPQTGKARSPRDAGSADNANAAMVKATAISPPALPARDIISEGISPAAFITQAVPAPANNAILLTWSTPTNQGNYAYLIYSKSFGFNAAPNSNYVTGWYYLGWAVNTNQASFALKRASGLPITNLFWKVIVLKI
jgi:hypothetical protein